MSVTDVLDFDTLEEQRPQNVYDSLNCEAEQANKDDELEGMEDNLDVAPIQFDQKAKDDVHVGSLNDSGRFRKIQQIEDEELMSFTLNLVAEQKQALTKVLNFCKDIVKSRYNLDMKIAPLHLLIHGGAGKLTS
jgi:hypothetical protein